MHFSRFPRVNLAHLPTALEPMDRLSKELGGPRIWIKRDDCTGMSTGGNKTRKLEFLMGEALEQGADMVMTQGATQSNHARQTAAFAARLGLDCHILLEDRTGSNDPNYNENGNVFLDFLHGATAEKHPGGADMPGLMEARAEEHRAKGRKVYVIPGGGSNPTGALGYANAAMEIVSQANAMGLEIDRIVHATGSAGTQAGLITGLKAINANIPLLGIGTRAPKPKQEENVFNLAVKTAEKLGCPGVVSREDVVANTDYVGQGYGIPTESGIEAIEMFAQLEGLLLDPVYSGKGAAGMIDLIRKGEEFKNDKNIVFLHTGGGVGLFGYTAAFNYDAPVSSPAAAEQSLPMQPFTGSFTQQEPIADDAIAAAVEVLRSGRLHRYNTVGDELGPVAELEKAYAAYQGSTYCLACTSGGYAMATALRALGVGAGDRVLTNGFTLAPVPGSIAAVGAEAVLVEITSDLVIDLDDLDAKIVASEPKAMLLSNMRGHLCDMDALMAVLDRHGVPLIEDCAHTMGAAWNGRKSGSFGIAGCFSTQTYKHMNSGEGGLLTSNDPEFMARAIMLSGSYMLYERHGAGPAPEVFKDIRLDTPNMSGRMDNLRASILLTQLASLETNIDRWNDRHDLVADRLRGVLGVYVPHRPKEERYVGSSFQFLMPGASAETMQQVVAEAKSLGVELKWFGADSPVGFTSNHQSWRYVMPQELPKTDAILAGLLDIRIPLTFSLEDCAQVADIIFYVVGQALQKGAA